MKVVLKFLGLLLASYFCIAVGLTATRSNKLTPERLRSESRVSGWSQDGWTGKEFTFKDERVFWRSAKLKVNLDSWRPHEAARTLELGAITKPRIANLPYGPEGAELRVENTFQSPDSRHIGVKLKSVELVPRLGILLPSLTFALPLLPVAALLLGSILALLYSLTQSRYLGGIFVLAITITSLLFAIGVPERWPRLTYLALFFGCLAVGTYLFSRLREGTAKSPIRHTTLILAVIVLAGGVLRFSAVDFGLPALFHPDEPRKAYIAERIVREGNWDPRYFKHPSFMIYSSALIGKTLGGAQSVADFVLYGRITSATLGTLSLVLVFLIASLLHNRRTGLVASSLLAFAPLHVVCSRYLKEDACLLFFVLLSTYLSLLALRDKSYRYFFLSCLAAGFATSVKYSGLLSFPIAFLYPLREAGIFLARYFDRSLPKVSLPKLVIIGCAGLVVATLGFLAVTPYAVLNSETFVKDFLWEKKHMEQGHSRKISAASHYWMFHLGKSLLPGLSEPLGIFALIALGWLIARRRYSDLFIIGLVLLFYLPAEWVKAKPAPQPERYILPVLPFILIGAAAFWDWLSQHSKRSLPVNALLVILLLSPLLYSLPHSLQARTDTRVLAANWVEQNVPKGSTVLVDWYFYNAPISRRDYRVREIVADRKFFVDPTPENVEASGAEYLLLSSLYYQRYLDKTYVRVGSIADKVRHLLEAYEPEVVFSKPRYAYGFHNPSIAVYKVPDENSERS